MASANPVPKQQTGEYAAGGDTDLQPIDRPRTTTWLVPPSHHRTPAADVRQAQNRCAVAICLGPLLDLAAPGRWTAELSPPGVVQLDPSDSMHWRCLSYASRSVRVGRNRTAVVKNRPPRAKNARRCAPAACPLRTGFRRVPGGTRRSVAIGPGDRPATSSPRIRLPGVISASRRCRPSRR